MRPVVLRWEGLRLFNTDQLWRVDAEVVGEVWPSGTRHGEWAWSAACDDGGVEPTKVAAMAACEAVVREALGGARE